MMKINKNKILYVTLPTVLLLGTLVLPVFSIVTAQQQTQPTDLDILKAIPSLSSAEIDKTIQITISDPRVQQIINGRSWKFTAMDFVGNMYATPITAYPEVHLEVADTEQITAVVHLQKQSVINLLNGPVVKTKMVQAGMGGPVAIAWDLANINNANGMQMLHNGVSYSNNDGHFALFFVNAVEPGYTESSACVSSHIADSYFAQVGVNFGSTAKLAWTDTSVNCAVQTTSIPYTNLHTHQFRIFVSGTCNGGGYNWVVTGKDLNSGQYFIRPLCGINNNIGANKNTFQTNDINTSVWLEHTHTDTTWYNEFNPTKLAAQAKYSTDGGNSWTNWPSQSTKDKNCTNNPTTPSIVISGSLANGGTATWDVQKMASTYPDC